MRRTWCCLLTLAAVGCANGHSDSGDARLGALPAAGSVAYAFAEDGMPWSVEGAALRGARPPDAAPLTQTDHRTVAAISPDGGAVVIDDHHDDDRRGRFVRWRQHGRSRTIRLALDPLGPAALCGSRAVLWWDAGRLLLLRLGASRPSTLSFTTPPVLLACADAGLRVAAVDARGGLTVGSARGGMRGVTMSARLSDVAWSPDGRHLGACAVGRDVLVLTPGGSPLRVLARSRGGCELAWSPYGHVAFTSAGRVMVACLCNASAVTIAGDAHAFDPVWAPDGRAVAYGEMFGGVHAVGYPAGVPVAVTRHGSPVAWLGPQASRRAIALADRYPCC